MSVVLSAWEMATYGITSREVSMPLLQWAAHLRGRAQLSSS